jgi:hypothetical protein
MKPSVETPARPAPRQVIERRAPGFAMLRIVGHEERRRRNGDSLTRAVPIDDLQLHGAVRGGEPTRGFPREFVGELSRPKPDPPNGARAD